MGGSMPLKKLGEGAYGHERQFYGSGLQNRNRLISDITARRLHAVMTGAWVSPLASARLRDLLCRSINLVERQPDPEN